MTAEVVAETELDPEEFYRTDDMALATFLKINSHPLQQISWIGPTCYWYFRITDALLNATEDFLSGEASVDPLNYTKKLEQTRKEFYASKDLAKKEKDGQR